MQRTAFQALAGLTHPIVQGPFGGGLSTVKLSALVSNKGGLGSFGAQMLSGDAIMALTRDMRAGTNGAFAINLWVSDDEAAAAPSFSREDFAKAWAVFEPLYRE